MSNALDSRTESIQFTQIQPSSIHSQIVDQIRKKIISGELAPGDRLPSERNLKDQFQVSRASLREGLNILKAQGLIDIRPGSGVYVTEGQPRDISDGMTFSCIPTCPGDIVDLLEFRTIIECKCIELAADNITEADVCELEDYMNMSRSSNQDLSVIGDREFHYLIAKRCNNKYLIQCMGAILSSITEAFTIMRGMKEFHSISQKSWTEHNVILSALNAHDAKAAKLAMRTHLTSVQNDICKSL